MFMYCFFERLTNRANQRNRPIIGNIIFIIFFYKQGLHWIFSIYRELELMKVKYFNTSGRTGDTELAISLSIRLFIISGPHALPT